MPCTNCRFKIECPLINHSMAYRKTTCFIIRIEQGKINQIPMKNNLTEEQNEFSRLIELNRKQAESLLEDSKKAIKAADSLLEDSKKQMLAAQSLRLLIAKFVEMSKAKETTRLPLIELTKFLMEHRN